VSALVNDADAIVAAFAGVELEEPTAPGTGPIQQWS